MAVIPIYFSTCTPHRDAVATHADDASLLHDSERWSCSPCRYPSIPIARVRGACSNWEVEQQASWSKSSLPPTLHESKLPSHCPKFKSARACGQTFYKCASSEFVRCELSRDVGGIRDCREEEVEEPKDELRLWRDKRIHTTNGYLPPVHYFRIPKTGSSATTKLLLPKLGCHLIMHGHGDGGVDLQWLSGLHFRMPPNERSIVTIREPCQRFSSVHRHMLRASTMYSRLVTRHAGRSTPAELHGVRKVAPPAVPSYDDAISWLSHHANARGCYNQSVTCFARAINDALADQHRVILWPQRFYIPKERVAIICHGTQMMARHFAVHLQKLTKCKAKLEDINELLSTGLERINVGSVADGRQPEPMSKVTCSRVRQLYSADARLWDETCSHGQGR